jgi:BirA family biotin operon repressor/biotin-[acetyl-CoA-carboxylase] ligase
MSDTPTLEALLRSATRFSELHHVASCPSTQDLASARPRDAGGRFVDAVFWADHQTRGRGRQQREWHDEPAADLAVTFRVKVTLPTPLALPAALPVAVALAVEPLAGRPLRIKWPNDVYLDGRKLCGVLIDAGSLGPDTYLIGVGINCNRVRFPPELEAIGTSLAIATGREIDRGALLLALAGELDRMLRALTDGRRAEFEAVFRDRLGLLGKRVQAQTTEVHEGVLTALDFTQLVLDDRRPLPLGTVRSLRAV